MPRVRKSLKLRCSISLWGRLVSPIGCTLSQTMLTDVYYEVADAVQEDEDEPGYFKLEFVEGKVQHQQEDGDRVLHYSQYDHLSCI